MMRRNGFTLMEVIVALAVGGIVLVTAARSLAMLGDRSRALVERQEDLTRDANGEAMLRDLVGRLEVGAAGTLPFAGDPDTARFTSWCDVPAGWLERCDVTLSFAGRGTKRDLVAVIGGGHPVALISGLDRGTFRYLQSAANGGRWFSRWGASITQPLGIGAVISRGARLDTLILRIGDRG